MRHILAAAALLSLLAAPAQPEPIPLTGRIEPAEALPGARVELQAYPREGQSARPPVTTRPAADGSFKLTAPEAGLYRLTVQAEGYLPNEIAPLPVLEEEDLPPLWLMRAPAPRESAQRAAPDAPPVIQKGRVLDAVAQAPLPGALVWQAGLGTAEAVPWTWSGADGSFRLALRGPDPTLGAAAAGHLTISRYSLTSDAPVTLALRPVAILAGEVVGPDSRPVAGASVSASPKDPVFFARPGDKASRTGADGRFRLRGLAPETTHRLSVNAEGFVSAWQEAEIGKPRQAAPPVRIVLDRGVVFTGRIVDPDVQPIAGADLDLSTAADGPEERGYSTSRRMRAASDATGRFRFEHVGKGNYSMQVRRPGFAPAYRSGTVGTNPEGVVDLGDLTLQPGAVIEGLVTDPKGRPVEGARIGLSDRGSPRSYRFRGEEAPVLTGPDGSFRIIDLEAGRRFSLSVHKPGHVMARLPGVEAPTREPLHVELRKARSLSGRVLDSERRPVADARISQVEAQEMGMGDNSSFSRSSHGLGQTDQDGRFLLSGLEPGPLHLEVRAQGFRTADLSGLRVPDDEDPAPLEIVLEAGPVLEGRVLDSRDQPVRANVEASLPDSDRRFGFMNMTDEEGRYRIDGLEPGEYRVEAQSFGNYGRRTEGKVVLGDSGTYRLDLRLPSGVRVSGQVIDEQGEPLPGARASLQGNESGYSASSAADGSFHFEDVPDGLYWLIGSSRSHVQVTDLDEVSVAGQEVSGLVLRLARGGTITVRIAGVTDEDRESLRIEAHREGGSEELGDMTHGLRGSGDYRLTVAPGTWRVTASFLSGLSAAGTVHVGAGEDIVLDLEMPRGLTLSGRVLVDGQPLPGAQVSARGAPEPGAEGAEQPSAGTRYDGSFALHGLRLGHLTLTVLARGIYHVQSLDLAADRQITIDILTGRLAGSVLAATGEPIEGVLVALRGEHKEAGIWSETVQALTDERGTFEVSRLAAGSYRITVTREGFAPASQTVTVTPGGTTEVQVVLKLEEVGGSDNP